MSLTPAELAAVANFGTAAPPGGLGLIGSIKEVGKQALGGLAVDFPKMVGEAGRAVTSSGGEANKFLSEMQANADMRAPDFAPDPNAGTLTKYLGKGARGIAVSAPLMAVGMLGGPVAGIATGAGLFGLSSGQEGADEARAAGGSADDISKAALLKGSIGALAGGLGQAVGAKYLWPGLMSGGLSAAEKATGVAALDALGSKAPGYLANYAKGIASDTTVMGMQGGASQAVSNAYGGQDGSVFDAAREGAVMGSAMGVVGGTLGLHHTYQTRKVAAHVRGMAEHLTDPNTPIESFTSTLDGMSQMLTARGVAPDAVKTWQDQVSQARQDALAEQQKGIDLLDKSQSTATTAASAAAPVADALNQMMGLHSGSKLNTLSAKLNPEALPSKLWAGDPEAAMAAMKAAGIKLDAISAAKYEEADRKVNAPAYRQHLNDTYGTPLDAGRKVVDTFRQIEALRAAGVWDQPAFEEAVNLTNDRKYAKVGKLIEAASKPTEPAAVSAKETPDVSQRSEALPVDTVGAAGGGTDTSGRPEVADVPGVTPAGSGVADSATPIVRPDDAAPGVVADGTGKPVAVVTEAPAKTAVATTPIETKPVAAPAEPGAVEPSKSIDVSGTLTKIAAYKSAKMQKALRLVLGLDEDGHAVNSGPLEVKAAATAAGYKSHSEVSRATKELGITEIGVMRLHEGLKLRPLDEARSDLDIDADHTGSNQGDINADVEAPKDNLGAQKWYKTAAERGLHNLEAAELGALAARASKYVEDPKSAEAFNAIMSMVRSKSIGDEKYAAELEAAYARGFQRPERESVTGSPDTPTVVRKGEPRSAAGADQTVVDAEGRGHADNATNAQHGPAAADEPASRPDSAGREAAAVRDAQAADAAPDQGNLSTPKITVRKSRTFTKPDAEARYSHAEPGRGSTVDEVHADVASLGLGRSDKVVVVNSADELPPLIQKSIEDEHPQAFVLNGKAYLIADNIRPGNARAVFMHEVGVHLGLEDILSAKEFGRLVDKITEWADRNDGSQESELARRAIERVGQADTPDNQLHFETAAYFVEEAVKAGVDPTALQYKGELARWMGTLFRALKAAVAKLGIIKTDTLTPQDIVDMAYGAAHLTMNSDERGNYTGEAPQFSKSADPAIEKAKADVAAKIPQRVKDVAINTGSFFEKHLPRMLTLNQLVQKFDAPDKLPSIRKMSETIEAMVAVEASIIGKAKDTFFSAQHIHSQARNDLEGLMLDSTRARIHADRKLDDKSHAHLTPADVAAHKALSERFQKLTKTSPKAAELYRKLRDTMDAVLKSSREATKQELRGHLEELKTRYAGKPEVFATAEARIKKEIDGLDSARTFEGPYFPLTREGQYIATGRSKELTALLNQLKADLGNSGLKEKVAALEDKDAHNVMSIHDTKAKQQRAVAQYAARGMDTSSELSARTLPAMRGKDTKTLEAIREIAKSYFTAKDAKEFSDLLDQYSTGQTSPNSALSRRMARAGRAGVAGVSADSMLHNAAVMVEKEARYQANHIYGRELDRNLLLVGKESRGNNQLGEVYHTMAQHVNLMRNPVDSAWSGALRGLVYTWEIGIQPARMLTYMMQPHMLSVPVLAGKHGYGKALGAMNAASSDVFRIMKTARNKDGWRGATGLNLDAAEKAGHITARELELLQHMQSTAQLEMNMHSDLSSISHAHSSQLGRAMDAIHKTEAWALGHIDTTTRMATALAAYRLELSKGGKHEAAMQFAQDHTKYTQFEYGASSAPVYFKGSSLAKLMAQFKRYQQGSLNLVAQEGQKAFHGDTGAMKTLGALLLTHGLIAGAVGMPLAQSVMGLANLFIRDDDPNGDAQTRLRRLMYSALGNDAGQAVMDGLTAPLGLNFTRQLGMGSILTDEHLIPAGFGRVYGARNRDKVSALAHGAFGPAAGFAERVMAARQFYQEGDYMRSVQELLPETIAGAWDAAMWSSRGMQDGKGHVAIKPDNISAGSVAAKALGFEPEQEAMFKEQNSEKNRVEATMKLKRANILTEFANRSMHQGDTSGAIAAMKAYNEVHSGTGTAGRLTMADMLRARQEFMMRELFTNQNSGVSFNPRKDRQVRGLTDLEN